MKLSKYILLLQKRHKKDLDKTDQADLSKWQNSFGDAVEEDAFEKIWDWSASYQDNYEPDVEAGLAKFKSRIAKEETPVVPIRAPKKNKLFPRIAAAVLLLLVFAWLLSTYISSEVSELLVSTGANEQKTVQLADGSTVVLNQNSKLYHSNSYKGAELRVVRLEGEAFFDVAHNPEQPFRIYTAESEVNVLGTSFNVRAYLEEETTEVDVVSGKVQFVSRDQENETILIAEEKGILSHEENQMEELEEMLPNAHSWRTGKLQFRNSPLEDVIQAVERHYLVSIETESLRSKFCPLTMGFTDNDLETILETLKLQYKIEVAIQNKDTYQFSGGRACE